MKRATVLGLAFAAALRAPAAAQQAGRTYRVGILAASTATANVAARNALVRKLAALGYREGQNLELVVRSTGNDQTRAPALANELVRAKPDVIVGASTPVIVALKRATTSIPIVMVNAADAVGSGLVASLARPGGNITGMTTIDVALEGKRLQLLTELVPHPARIAYVDKLNGPLGPIGAQQFRAACRQLGIEALTVDVESAGDIDGALKGLPQKHVDAALVSLNPLLVSNARRVVELVAAQRLPTAYGASLFPAAGGLLSYGVSVLGEWALAATYVDRILKGAKPADLPVQQPTTFDLVVNLKAAREIGLTVPQSILLQATQVIR